MQTLLKNNRLAFISFLLLIMSLFAGRAALSIVSAIMIFFAFTSAQNKSSLKYIIVGVLCILLPVWVSGLWSLDKELWWQSAITKLPLLTICLGVISMQLSKKQWKTGIWLLSIAVLLCCLWSNWQYVIDKDAIIKSYLVARIIPVALDNDHIRFSWLVVLTMIVLYYQLKFQSTQKEKITGGIILLLLGAYLHLLAAKTGLLCLYVALLIELFSLLFQKKQWKTGLLTFIIIAAAIFIAYQSIPTLHNRVQYAVWNFHQYSNGKFEEGSADGDRILSMRAGWDITQKHPVAGVGFGDIKSSITQWHQQFHPLSKDYERFSPTNEWLVFSAGSGWFGAILFSIGLIILLSFFSLKNIFSVSLCTILLIPLITDDSLEGQYGVAIFSIFLCLGYDLNRHSNDS